ncbi:hypothetical protein EB796_009677 [Bugula neritina]|uniref:Fibrillar collagen NC1 domain-containing protein n=1 Tax=Bugula neritina TaxID=10212 RepID=A0A7J7K232_BUGNE|nr:hypothetical protein EB796_009677 [Bugula neritina]
MYDCLSTPSTSVRIKNVCPISLPETCSLSSECTQHQTCSSGTCKSTISSGCSGTRLPSTCSLLSPMSKKCEIKIQLDLNVLGLLGSNCGAAFSHFTVLKMNNVDLSSLNAYPTYAISFILSTIQIFLILSRTDSLMIGWIYRMIISYSFDFFASFEFALCHFVVFQIPSEALTVIEIDTKTATHLPIIDIAPGDIWTTHKEFGVQLGEVCFS